MKQLFLFVLPLILGFTACAPKVTPEQQQPIIDLVNTILEAKSQDSKADTTELEKQIDQLVYILYDLTDEEIALIEQ